MNNNIKCSVEECKFHDCNNNVCTLNSIQIGKTKMNVDCKDCTECASFVKA